MNHRIPTLALLGVALLALAACGGGGPAPVVLGEPPPPSALTITTQNLPGAAVGAPYAPQQLQAVNAQGTPVWDLASGALPDGLILDPDGTLHGTATEQGTSNFVARVSDDVASDTQPLSLSVGVLTMTAVDGLTFGDAWTQKPVTLTTSGATTTVTFSIVTNDSGGAFSNENPAAGTATWTPGPNGGAGFTDTLRATDDGTGNTIDLDLAVMPNPAIDHVARFGTTDVWWIAPDLKFGSHPFVTDVHQMLADAGLRSPDSTGATGTTADELALLYFRVELLRQVNPMFLRNADGTAGASGLAISFPLEEPGAGFTKPAAADSLFGSPTRYSQMALIEGGGGGVVGTAFLDGSSNDSHENDTTEGTLELGVFINEIVGFFNASYQNTVLPALPVNSLDEAALRALLYGLPDPGGRYALIKYVTEGLARTVGAVLAHEVGHSIGLGHNSPSEPGAIMNSSATISPSSTYAFTSENQSTLQSALPGAGKSTGGQTAQKAGSAGMPEGGVIVCRCRAR